MDMKAENAAAFGRLDTQFATLQGSINILNYRLDHPQAPQASAPSGPTPVKP
jgi:hypothetical protein